MGVNKVILLGNLGADPELRYTASQVPVCTLRIATSERRKDADGNWTDHTEWHRVVTFGRTAENCSTYLKKGRQAYIEGRIQTNKWQDKEGKDRYTTEVIASTVQFIGGGRQSDNIERTVMDVPAGPPDPTSGMETADNLVTATAATANASSADSAFEDDDIPF